MFDAARRLLPALICFGIAFALYLVTLAPGVHWGDHAELQIAASQPEFGLGARSYPLWTALAAGVVGLFSLEPAFGANLLSAFFGALAVALCYLYVSGAFGSRRAAIFAAFSLTVSHLLWSASTAAEVYSLVACFLFLLLMAAEDSLQNVRRGAFLLGLIAGLSLLHHRMIQLAAVSMLTVLVVIWLRRGALARGLLFGLLGTLVGAVPLAILFLLIPQSGGLVERVNLFLLGGFRAQLPTHLGVGAGLLGLVLYGVRFMAFNLAGPQGFTFLLSAGRRRVPHPGHRSLLFALLLGSLPLLLIQPHVGDRYVMMLPAVCAAAVLAGIAAAERMNRGYLRILLPALALLCPPVFYGVLARSEVPERLGLFKGLTAAHREAFLWPGHSGDRSASEFAGRVLETIPEGALLLTEWGDGCALQYVQQTSKSRPDIEIRQSLRQREFARVIQNNPHRRIFVTTYPHAPLLRRAPPGFTFLEELPGMLWVVLRDKDR
jgi:4-amino-4-deoxy-L-arabinose transferase-like glycosyltransferase